MDLKGTIMSDELKEKAVELKQRPDHNCCQAVASVLTNGDPVVYQLASGFGGGMGTGKGTCGALVGAVMAAGLLTEGKDPIKSYRSQLTNKFIERCGGSCVCRELKGIGTGKVLCSCEDCVRNAVEVFREVTGRETI